MKHLLDVRTFIFGLILAVLGVGYSIANVVVIPLGGDSSKARMFYVTDGEHKGNQAITACDSGYHMSSMFELLNSSNLRYDRANGYVPDNDDMGEGPPTGTDGWVRTGGIASIGDEAGSGNCGRWSISSGGGQYGTFIGIDSSWTNTPSTAEINPWYASKAECDSPQRVWCIQDY